MLDYLPRENPNGIRRLGRREMLRLADIARRGQPLSTSGELETEFAGYIKKIMDCLDVLGVWECQERMDALEIWPVLIDAGWTANL